jgi:acyl carrier protein
VSDAMQARDLFGVVERAGRPLRGIFHAAAVIIDESIVDLDPRNFAAVMRSKAESARLLDEHSRHLPLDYFVLYSSVANLGGNSRQSAYASANGYLDGLAWRRRAEGLPATSINWGAIADAGVIARDETLEQFMRYMGFRGMETREALGWLERVLNRGTPQMGVALITNWVDWARYETLGAQSPRIAMLLAGDTVAAVGARDVLRTELEALPADERLTVLAGLVAALIADELDTSADAVAIDRPLQDIGVDSLMATGIQLALDRDLGINVAVLEILNGATVRAIAGKTLASFGWEA